MSASWQWAKANPDTAARLIRELQRENIELRNEIARLNGQTNWVCKCGGTDCEGRKENAALRADKERLDWLESGCSCDLSWVGKEAPPSALTSLRNAIDWTRKEAQR